MNNSERYWRGDDTVGRDDLPYDPAYRFHPVARCVRCGAEKDRDDADWSCFAFEHHAGVLQSEPMTYEQHLWREPEPFGEMEVWGE